MPDNEYDDDSRPNLYDLIRAAIDNYNRDRGTDYHIHKSATGHLYLICPDDEPDHEHNYLQHIAIGSPYRPIHFGPADHQH